MPPLLLLWLSFLFLNKERMEDEQTAWKRVDKKIKKSNITVQLTFFGALIYSVFLPLTLETPLLWIGLFIYMIGIIFATMAVLVFTATPKDRPVTNGIYRISRNPMYLGMFMIFIGVGTACVSWIFLISAVARLTHQNFVGTRKHIETLLTKEWIKRVDSAEHDESIRYRTTSAGKRYLGFYLQLWNYAFDPKKDQ